MCCRFACETSVSQRRDHATATYRGFGVKFVRTDLKADLVSIKVYGKNNILCVKSAEHE